MQHFKASGHDSACNDLNSLFASCCYEEHIPELVTKVVLEHG